jgi:uncharacterized protein involved in exopolysaccharide biosynthesis
MQTNVSLGAPIRVNSPQESVEDEINLRDLGRLVWNGRWLILGMAIAGTLIAYALVSFVHKKYDAKILMVAVTEDSQSERSGGGTASSIASQLGGLVSLAGISGSGGGFRDETIATLKSEILTEQYIRDNNLLPILYAKKWDAQNRKWKTDDPKQIPTLWKANQLFETKLRTVSDNAKTALCSLTITWTDSRLAAQWANGLVKLTNLYLRDKAIAEAERRIAYLKSQVAETNVVELQRAIYSLMESEINKEMLARGSDEYALKVVDPAVVAEEPASPKRLVWLAAGLLSGLLVGFGIVLARGRVRSTN